MISVNGVAVDPAGSPSPELAAARELLRQRAVALGLAPEDADDAAAAAAIEALLDAEVQTPTPAEAECRRYYDAHQDRFRSGDIVHARHILFQIASRQPARSDPGAGGGNLGAGRRRPGRVRRPAR